MRATRKTDEIAARPAAMRLSGLGHEVDGSALEEIAR